MNALRFLATRKVYFLILLIGLIAMGLGDCFGPEAIRVFVSNQTENNFHINSTDGTRVKAGVVSVLPVMILTRDTIEDSFQICREKVGCVKEITVDSSDYPWGEEEENQQRFINVTVVIEEPEPMVFEVSCDSEKIKVTIKD